MHDNILVDKLCMSVDPSDGEYRPSKVVVSVGDSKSTLKDITTTDIGKNESMVTLLQDQTQVRVLFCIQEGRCSIDVMAPSLMTFM